MIKFQSVSKTYFNEKALDSVNFSIEKGDFAFLIGPTGSGKTTIFRLIIKDLVPTEGKITIGELDIASLPKNKIKNLRRKVGVIFQDLKLLHDRTVLENVMLPLLFSGMSENDAKDKVEEILIDVDLTDKTELFPMQLSGGEKQRVSIARALVFDPEVILADEPTGNLDFNTSIQILDLLESINKKGTTIFMATHNERLVEKTKRGILKLENGRIKADSLTKSKSAPALSSKKENDKKEKEDEAPKNKGKIKLESLKMEKEKK